LLWSGGYPITADNRTPNLVNNLDLKIIDNTGKVFYPWKLDPTALFNQPVKNSDNRQHREGVSKMLLQVSILFK
jgi:hypothetical protein